MADFYRDCSLYQGFNFKKDEQYTCGYLKSLKIGTTEFKADFTTLKDPLAPDTAISAVGVFTSVSWGIGPTDAIYLTFNVSTANKTEMLTMIFNSMVNIDVELKFDTYEFDPIAKVYYKCFHTVDAVVKGLIEKTNGNLGFHVNEYKSTEVEYPENYAVQIAVKPQKEEQTLNIATASQKNIVKKWGSTNA